MEDYININKAITNLYGKNPQQLEDANQRQVALVAAPAALAGAIAPRNPWAYGYGLLGGATAGLIDRLLYRKRLAERHGINVNLLGVPVND